MFVESFTKALNNENNETGTDSVLYVRGGLIDNVMDLFAELKQGGEQFHEQTMLIRETYNDIISSNTVPYFSAINQGRNNKQSSETIGNNMNKFNRIEIEKKQKELV
jgi:archaellum biogenesis protein FlaJ (TadC family)